MKRIRYTERRRVVAAILCLLLAGITMEAYADIVKKGEGYVPGYCNPKRKIKWRAAHSKTPYGNQVANNQVHFWLDIELCDPPTDPADPIYQNGVTFVVCCMLNIKGAKVNQPSYLANPDSVTGLWTCTANGNTSWYHNYHFGCKRVVLKPNSDPNKHWKHNVFDALATFTVNFAESDIAAPYFDFAVDCPNGFSGCGGLFGQADQFLTPGDGNFPFKDPTGCDGTSSWWIYQGGNTSYNPAPLWRAPIPTGNWYTMKYMSVSYPSRLQGTLTNAPIGSTLTVKFPPSAGVPDQALTVATNPFEVSIPFTISSQLMHDDDEHTYIELTYPETLPIPNPNAVIEFNGKVLADAASNFPDGRELWATGDVMHGVQIQFIPDFDDPFVVSEQVVQLSPTEYEVRVEAGDVTTMVTGATFAYRVNGVDATDYGIPFDDPSMSGTHTLFRGTVTVPAGSTISDCRIITVDDAGNTNNYLGANIMLSADHPESTLGFVLHQSKPNPFSSTTLIPFTLPRRAHVTLEVLDLNGRTVAALLDEERGRGEHVIEFDANAYGLPDGTYYYRMRSGNFVMTKRMVLLKEAQR